MVVTTLYAVLIGGYVANSLFLLAYMKRGVDTNLKLHFISQWVMMATYAAILSRLVLPEMFSVVLGGILSFAGLEIELLALMMTLRPLSRTYIIRSVGSAAAALLAFTATALLKADTGVRIVVFSMLSILLVAHPCWSYLRESRRSGLKAAIGLMLLVFQISFAARIVDAFGRGEEVSLFAASPVQVFFYASQVLYMLLAGTGLILLSKERTDRRLLDAATRDALTGILNRGTFEQEAWKAISFAMRKDIPFTLMMFDVDDFKRINDTYGHHIGDEVLRDFARSVNTGIRVYDSFGRNGGDEFILLLQSVDRSLIDNVATRLRARTTMPLPDGVPYTVSAGALCVEHPKGMNLSYDSLIIACDRAMYGAKTARDGRLAVVGSEVLESAASFEPDLPAAPGAAAG